VDEKSLLQGVHVHVHPDLMSNKEVDDTYDVVALRRGDKLVVVLDTASSTALVQSRIVGVESSLIGCPRCGAEHVDEGWFAGTPHRKHQCMCCGREFYDRTAGSDNTTETRTTELLPKRRYPRVCPNREVDLTQHLDTGRNTGIWGTHEAIVRRTTRRDHPSGAAAVSPSCSRKCQRCGKITITYKRLVINPLASLDAAASTPKSGRTGTTATR